MFQKKIELFIRNIKQDIKNFDFDNTSEKNVAKSNYFSSYKRKLVIWTCLKRSGSFGILFLTNRKKHKPSIIDEIRHEYGHTKQLEQLGVLKYAAFIMIPSYFQLGKDVEYYRRPWEITADIYGGVKSRKYPEYEKAGFNYLKQCKRQGIMNWLKLRCKKYDE